MCWNKEVSLNTFVFSTFMLFFIIYNNIFTKYKILEIHNLWVYLFFISFIIMQLIEYFIWVNIHNKIYNNIFSIVASLLLIIQPLVSLMILTNIEIRNLLLFSYLLLVIPYSIYKYSNSHVHSEVSKKGHLQWVFLNGNIFIWLIWLFFFFFSLVYEKKWTLLFFAIIIIFIATMNYTNDNTIGSIWCWGVNSIMIYYAIYILLILPFIE